MAEEKTMALQFRPVTRQNFFACCQLSVAEKKRPFVAPNSYSLAQSKFEPECEPFAIYDGEEMVGFIMFAIDPKTNDYWIHRFMIDQKLQNRGYGKAAFRMALERLENDSTRSRIFLDVNERNPIAQRMYEGFGFAWTGEMNGDERIMLKQYR